MPIYEYECTGCHHHFDLMQKINDKPETHCPKCSEDKAVRQISAAGFQLKGTGWYVTDFKNKNSSGSQTPDTKNKDTSSKATSSSADSAVKSTTKGDAE